MQIGPVPGWLDTETRSVVQELSATLISTHPDLLAIILFGSMARHDERPIDDPEPSDVDVLIICDVREPWEQEHSAAIFRALGEACRRHPGSLREVNLMLGNAAMDRWDPGFIDNVAHDGMLLFQAPHYRFAPDALLWR